MNKNNFIFKPLAIVQDERLTPLEQDYLCLIAQLQNAAGCIASNNYFADYFKVARQSSQEIIGRLKSKGFISCKEQKSGGKTIKRTIDIIDGDSRKLLLSISRENLPKVGRKSPAGLAGNSDKVSRKPPTHTTDNTTELQRSFCFIDKTPAENIIRPGLYACDECFAAYKLLQKIHFHPQYKNIKISKHRLPEGQLEKLIQNQKAKLNDSFRENRALQTG